MTERQAIEEEGFEALQRLYVVATGPAGPCARVARFLLALYNGQRFPLDLSELRVLDTSLFEDCMKVLRMDARVTAREVHLPMAGASLRRWPRTGASRTWRACARMPNARRSPKARRRRCTRAANSRPSS